MAAAVYLRIAYSDNSSVVTLACSKTITAPLIRSQFQGWNYKLLTFEDVATFLAQVDVVFNLRPISALFDYPKDISALTSGHLNRGEAFTTISEPSFSFVPESELFHFQRIQKRFQGLWDRWSTECLRAYQSMSSFQDHVSSFQNSFLKIVFLKTK